MAESVEPQNKTDCAEVIQHTSISDDISLPIFVVMIRNVYVSSTVPDLYFTLVCLST